MKKTTLIALLTLLPSLAMANPEREQRSTDPQAEQERRRMIRTILGEMKAQYPKKFEHLMKLREENPAEFRRAMGDILRLKKAGHLRQPDPEIVAEKARFRELKEDFHTALQDYQNASESEKNKHRAELRDMAEEIFDAKQNLRRLRVGRIVEDLKALESEIAERDANREELIEKFVDEKIGATLKGL